MRYLLLSAIITMVVVAEGCKDDNPINSDETTEENLLMNSTFSPTSFDLCPLNNSHFLHPGMVEPWEPGMDSPKMYIPTICVLPDCNNTTGYLKMSGAVSNGGVIYQMLNKPMRKGRKYLVKANIRRSAAHSFLPFGSVRFLAFNTVLTYPSYWPGNSQGIKVIGSIAAVDTTCTEYSLPVWIADADYKGFAFNVETQDLEHTYRAACALIDDVKLIEVNESHE